MATEQQEPMATLTIPADLVRKLEHQAAREGSSVPDVIREMLRRQFAEDLRELYRRADEYNSSLPPTPYTEEDVPRLVKELRRELWAERQKQQK